MNKKFFTNLSLIAQSFLIFFGIQILQLAFGKVNPMLLGVIILFSSLSVFSIVLFKVYFKDKKERKQLSDALFEMN